MYDAILVSSHYNYSSGDKIFPPLDTEDYEDLSKIIPLGIIHIAQYLHNYGYEVRVVHIPHEMHTLKSFSIDEEGVNNPVEKILKNYPAHVCGIQVHWYLYCGGAIYISNLYKQLFPESKVFLGGFMATAYWKEFLEISDDIDGVILGEGEVTLKRILENTLDSRDHCLNDVNAVAFRNGINELIYNKPLKDSVLKLDEIPIIDPDSPPFKNIIWQKRHYINISRGLCPEKCSYCVGNNRDINIRKYQNMNIDKVLEQLTVYQDFGFHDLFLGESHFLNIPFMTELIENIIRKDFNLNFELETHPVIFENSDLLKKMMQARFFRYTMGCESGSDSLLRRIGRNSSSRQIIDCVRRISDAGGVVLTSWISNLPGETVSEFQETQEVMNAVVESGGFIYWIENLHVLPGSNLYLNPQNWGIIILLNNLDDWNRWSELSKKYVTFEEANEEPLHYLTHINKDVTPKEMIGRFYSNRNLARSLITNMRSSFEKKFNVLPLDINLTEMQALDWYENKGWKLWLY